MKKSQLILALIFIFSITLSAQDNKAVIAEYQADAKVFINDDNKSESNFTIICSKTDINIMTEEANKYGDYLTFESRLIEGKTDVYNVSLGFNHAAQPMEYFKIMTSMGFTGVKIGGEIYPLNHLLTLK